MVENAAKSGIRVWLIALAMGGFCLNASAGEKIQIEGEGVQLPKRKSLLEERGSSFDVLTEKPDPGGFAPPPVIVPGSAAQELLREYDREKNWIYRDPRELDKRATGLEKLERKESSNPLEPRQEQQSVLERYLTERERRQKESQELARDNPRLERERPGSEGRFNTFREESAFSGFNVRDREDQEFARELSLGAYLNRGQGIGAPQPVPDPYDRKYFGFSTATGLAGEAPQLSTEEQLDARKQEELRSANFQKLLQPRSITPSIAGVIDPIDVGNDPSRQPANPIMPSRPDPLDFGRGEGDNAYNSPAFTANAARTSLPDLNRSSALEAADIRMQSSGVSLSQPASAPAAAPAFSGPPVNSSAFTFEIPKRKF